MKSSKRIWNKEELTIAYYIAKWGLTGIDITPEELAELVIGNTTEVSLQMQVTHFRSILNIEDSNLTGASNVMIELINEYKDVTMTQIRAQVISKIQSSVSNIISNKKKKNALESYKRVQSLNADLQKNHDNKIASMRKYRNLKKL